MSNHEPIIADGAQLTAKQVAAIAAGYQIRESGRGYEVLNDNGFVVFAAATYLDAWGWCERMGGRSR